MEAHFDEEIESRYSDTELEANQIDDIDNGDTGSKPETGSAGLQQTNNIQDE